MLLRRRYLSYAVAIGICTGLFYLYSQGHNHWLYNPLLYQLWGYRDLGGPSILQHRAYVLALAVLFIAVAHLAYPRRTLRRR